MPPTPGILELVDQCEFMARAYAEAGAPLPRRRPDGFPAIVASIIGQQVSAHAGAAIQRKVEAGLGGITVEAVLARDDDELRGFGLSRPKVKYIRGVAEAVAAGEGALQTLRTRPCLRIRKSSRSWPSSPSAWARTPDGATSRCSARISGTSCCSAFTNAALENERQISPIPVFQ